MGGPNGVEWRDVKMIKNGWMAAEDCLFIVSDVTARVLGLPCCLYLLHCLSWKSYQEVSHKTCTKPSSLSFPPKFLPPLPVSEASLSTQVPEGQPKLECDPFLSLWTQEPLVMMQTCGWKQCLVES